MSLSNLIKFSTLKQPEIMINEFNSNLLTINLNIKCYYSFIDYDKVNDFNIPQGIDDPFDCEYYYYKWRKMNSVSEAKQIILLNLNFFNYIHYFQSDSWITESDDILMPSNI